MSTTAFLWGLLFFMATGSIGGLMFTKRRFLAKYNSPAGLDVAVNKDATAPRKRAAAG